MPRGYAAAYVYNRLRAGARQITDDDRGHFVRFLKDAWGPVITSSDTDDPKERVGVIVVDTCTFTYRGPRASYIPAEPGPLRKSLSP